MRGRTGDGWESRETGRPAGDYVSCFIGSWGAVGFVARVVGLEDGDTDQGEGYEG